MSLAPEDQPERSASRGGLPPAIPGGLAAVAFVLALIPLGLAWSQFSADARASSWRQVEATITTSRVHDVEYRDKQDGTRQSYQQLELAYEYSVSGRSYGGASVDPSGSVSHDPQELAAKYPVGAKVHAFYDPKHPASAALTLETSLSRYFLLAAGALLVVLGLAFGFGALKLWRG